MGIPQNPVVVLSFLGAAVTAIGALRRWRRGREQGISQEEAGRGNVSVDQMNKAGNAAELQVWTTGQGGSLKAVKGAWDDESSQKVVVNNAVVNEGGKDNASPQKGVSDNGVSKEGGKDNVSSPEGELSLAKPDGGESGAAVTPDAQGSPPKTPKKKKIVKRRKVSRAGSPKLGVPNVGATRDEGVQAKGPSGKVGNVPKVAEKSGKMQQEARGGVHVDQGSAKLNLEAPTDDKTCEEVNKASTESQEAPSEGDTEPEGATNGRMEEDKERESAKVPPSAEVPDTKRGAPSPFMGMKQGFLSSGKKAAPKAPKNEAVPAVGDAGTELEAVKGSQASRGVEGPVQQKKSAALVAKSAAPAEASPQNVPEESYSTPKKERYVDTEAGKGREESPERTPTSVLNAFPDSPESDYGGLSFAGPARGGASGSAWKRGPIFADRTSGGALEGGLLPLPVRSRKTGGDRERQALLSGGKDRGAAPGQGAKVESLMEGAKGKQTFGGVVGDGAEPSAAKSTERQLSLQTWLTASGGNSGKPGSDGMSKKRADGSGAAAPEPGGNKLREVQQRGGKAVEENGGAVEGSQRALPQEVNGVHGTASQQGGRQETPRGDEQLADRRQSDFGSETTATANGRKALQNPEVPSSQPTSRQSSSDLGSDKAPGSGTSADKNQTSPSDVLGRTTSQMGSRHGEESLEGFESVSKNYRTPPASPAPASPLLSGSNVAKPESANGSNSITKDCPNPDDAAPQVPGGSRLGWANSEQDLDGFDSATDSYATPEASAPAFPRMNQPGFANPKKEASAGTPASKCEIEEVASGQAEGIQGNGVPTREANRVSGKAATGTEVSAAVAAATVAAACAWCGHALGGNDEEELALCCMLALQRLQNEAKPTESGAKVGAIASNSGAAAASSQRGVTPAESAEREGVKELGNGVKDGGEVKRRQQNGVGGAGKREKTGAGGKAARGREVEAAALRAAEGARWAAKVRSWLEGTSYSDAAR